MPHIQFLCNDPSDARRGCHCTQIVSTERRARSGCGTKCFSWEVRTGHRTVIELCKCRNQPIGLVRRVCARTTKVITAFFRTHKSLAEILTNSMGVRIGVHLPDSVAFVPKGLTHTALPLPPYAELLARLRVGHSFERIQLHSPVRSFGHCEDTLRYCCHDSATL